MLLCWIICLSVARLDEINVDMGYNGLTHTIILPSNESEWNKQLFIYFWTPYGLADLSWGSLLPTILTITSTFKLAKPDPKMGFIITLTSGLAISAQPLNTSLKQRFVSMKFIIELNQYIDCINWIIRFRHWIVIVVHIIIIIIINISYHQARCLLLHQTRH